MCKKLLYITVGKLLLSGMLSLTIPSITHAQHSMSRDDVAATGHWLEAKKARFRGLPILLHLRTGHERALLMPEPVLLADAEHRSSGYEIDITGMVVRFFPTTHFDRESIRLSGVDTGTHYELQVRASAFGIRQPLQIFLID